jgi:class 3 adenylate cyclase/tetratricopeptide (TPR) repeat protein
VELQRQVVTFLMTDIVGSTGMWERDAETMGMAVARHDAIAARRIGEHGGRLVKPRGEGDSLFAVFEDPVAAIRCACDLQADLTSEPWPEGCALSVRTALNTGAASRREADYYGQPVNLCARLRSVAHGGQIVVSGSTWELTRDLLPCGVRLSDLGMHRLPGIANEVRAYQVIHPALRADFPPLRSLNYIPSNLPYPPNPLFVGRDELLSNIHAALTASPPQPVALVGIAGLGKTHAVIEYAHRHMSEYPGGVFFVGASDTTRLHLDCATLARFFDMPAHLTVEERAARVREELARSAELVLLIVDGLTETTEQQAIPGGPRCRTLVTCNQRHLVRHGYRIIEPPPLSEEAALRLLQSRRTAEDPDNRRAVQQTAAALGYLPLPLLLAANHVDRLGIGFADYYTMLDEAPAETLARARRRFISHTGHDGRIFDALALRYKSLEPPAPIVLIAASCFAGTGISPDRLCAAAGMTNRIAFDEAVADLVDDSLMARERGGRLSMHGMVRLMVREMAEPGAEAEALGRTMSVLADCLTQANDAMDWADARSELGHCLAAVERGRRKLCDERLERLLSELGRYHFHHGGHAAAAACFDESAALAEKLRGPNDALRALAIRRRGEARHRHGDRAGALADSLEALRLASGIFDSDSAEIADYHVTLGYILRMSGDLDAALPHYQHALAVLEAAYGRRHPAVATCLNNLGALREAQGDHQSALSLIEEALVIDTEVHGPHSPRVAIRLNNVGRVLGKLGHWTRSIACHEQAMAINEAAYGPSHPDIAGTHYHLGLAACGLGDTEGARTQFALALRMSRRYFDDSHPFCRMVREALSRLPAEAAGTPDAPDGAAPHNEGGSQDVAGTNDVCRMLPVSVSPVP